MSFHRTQQLTKQINCEIRLCLRDWGQWPSVRTRDRRGCGCSRECPDLFMKLLWSVLFTVHTAFFPCHQNQIPEIALRVLLFCFSLLCLGLLSLAGGQLLSLCPILPSFSQRASLEREPTVTPLHLCVYPQEAGLRHPHFQHENH